MHTENLIPSQLNVLKDLSPFMTQNGFYLAGGTALALYFGHRQSVDLDWFSPKAIGDVMILAGEIKQEYPLEVAQVASGTLHGTVNAVKISILEYRYSLIQPLTLWKEMGCNLASLDDLACMKLSAIAQRGARKDFLDVYHLVLKHKSLPELLKLYKHKYGVKDVMPVLYGLTYYADADQEPHPLKCSDNWKAVKRTIQSWIKDITPSSYK